MFVIIFYWLGGLRPEFQWFLVNWLSVLLIALTAQSIGYLFGAAFGTVQKAQTAATVTMLTLILCSGFWIKSVPPWLEWVKCALVTRGRHARLMLPCLPPRLMRMLRSGLARRDAVARLQAAPLLAPLRAALTYAMSESTRLTFAVQVLLVCVLGLLAAAQDPISRPCILRLRLAK